MLLERFYDDALAQASYLVGCQATGEAFVLDPNRDVDPYLEAAAREGMRIVGVSETHIHADYLSGARELARRTGATLYLSGDGDDPEWAYRYAAEDGATLVHDGDTLEVGRLRLRVLHTPGHTPEHICFELTDGAASNEPMGVFTGDFVFVGDVGRPDLLETAAGVAGTMELGARALWRSLERFRALPDYLQLWPGHGAGSACGKALGAVPQTTLGYEKRVNWAFACAGEDDFVRAVLEGQPEPPRYFAVMKRLNRDGPPLLGAAAPPPLLPVEALDEVLAGEGLVVDLRPRGEFERGHVPGTLSIPWNRSFTTWAGWLLPYDRPIHLLAAEERHVDGAVRALRMIGLDDVAGVFDAGALTLREARQGLRTAPVVDAAEAERARRQGAALLLDVRAASEWREGHVPGARHIHLGRLQDRLNELPRDERIIVHCRSGARSAIAQSLLLARGFERVENLEGGYLAWLRAGLPVERTEHTAGEGAPVT